MMNKLLTVVMLVTLGGCGEGGTKLVGGTDGGSGDGGLDAGSDDAGSSPRAIDLLLVIDDSRYFAGHLSDLQTWLTGLGTSIDGLSSTSPRSWHLGVVSADLGAGPFTLSNGQCHPGGAGAKLRGVGPAASATCAPLHAGKPYVDLDQAGGTSNLPTTESLGAALACAGALGSSGCMFSSPLESAYRALHDPVPENAGFLRADALLVVVFVTAQDDCSADASTDLFDPSKTAQYGALSPYRCTQFGIACGTPLSLMPYGDSGGPLSACAPATTDQGGKLLDVRKYTDYFATAGGVKADPSLVTLMAISGPTSPVSSVLGNPLTQPAAYSSCPSPNGNSCEVVLQHSCVGTNTSAVADPAIRLSAVVQSAAHRVTSSACDADYAAVRSAIVALAQ